MLCTMQLAMWQFTLSGDRAPSNFQLATLCEHFGVPFHAASAHEAWQMPLPPSGCSRQFAAKTFIPMPSRLDWSDSSSHLSSDAICGTIAENQFMEEMYER